MFQILNKLLGTACIMQVVSCLHQICISRLRSFVAGVSSGSMVTMLPGPMSSTGNTVTATVLLLLEFITIVSIVRGQCSGQIVMYLAKLQYTHPCLYSVKR